MNAENKITFEAFTERVAKRANLSDSEADAYIHQLAKSAVEALEQGEDVQLYRFGRFHTIHVDQRQGHNPKTGEALTVPEHTRVDFQPYKALLLAVNWPFRHLRTRMLAEEETGIRPRTIGWLILALAVLALIFVLISQFTGSSNESVVAAPPADAPAARMAPEQPATQATPGGVATVDKAAAPITPIEVTSATLIAPIATISAVPIASPATTNILVGSGDTLWGIAVSQWGDSSWWPVIYVENRSALAARNPDLIEIGSSVRMPVLTGSAAQPTQADLRQKTEAYGVVADDYAALGNARAAEYRLRFNRSFPAL